MNDVEASKVFDAMLIHARGTGGDSSERYTACAICACPEVYEQVDLARTWFMYLLWPCKLYLSISYIVTHMLMCSVLLIVTAGSHWPVDCVSSQAKPIIDNTYGSLVSADRERRSGRMMALPSQVPGMDKMIYVT